MGLRTRGVRRFESSSRMCHSGSRTCLTNQADGQASEQPSLTLITPHSSSPKENSWSSMMIAVGWINILWRGITNGLNKGYAWQELGVCTRNPERSVGTASRTEGNL